jgi:REP element-mobilizing transposase RayT
MKERKRNRKAGFDYSSQGIYFLTICCKDRIKHFGKIHNRKMELNVNGNILNGQIEWMEQQYPFFIIHNYIIMPNHLHILAEISRDRGESSHSIEMDAARIDGNAIGTTMNGDAIFDAMDGNAIGATMNGNAIGTQVRTGRDLSLRSPQKIKSISELIGALKTTSSKKIHLAGNLHFQWQRSFYDNIVKSENAYWTIYNYITQNPEKWEGDKFFNLD